MFECYDVQVRAKCAKISLRNPCVQRCLSDRRKVFATLHSLARTGDVSNISSRIDLFFYRALLQKRPIILRSLLQKRPDVDLFEYYNVRGKCANMSLRHPYVQRCLCNITKSLRTCDVFKTFFRYRKDIFLILPKHVYTLASTPRHLGARKDVFATSLALPREY